MNEEFELKSESIVICLQTLTTLQEAILSNTEIMKGVGTKNRYSSSGMALDVFNMSRHLYEQNLEFAKKEFN